MSVAQAILQYGRLRPDHPALEQNDRTITYAMLAGEIVSSAEAFLLNGIARGDRVGVCLGETPEHIAALFSLGLLAAVAVPLDWRAPPDENERLISGLGLKAIPLQSELRAPQGCKMLRREMSWRTRSDRPEELAGAAWDDPFVIAASSGSTGAPKHTMMTHLQLHFALAGMCELLDLQGRHRFLCSTPLYYSGSRNCALAHLTRGDTVVLTSGLPGATELIECVAAKRITVAAIVPSTVRELLAVPHTGQPLLPTLASLVSMGAPLYGEEKLAACERLTPNFFERYGTAETLGVSMLRPEHFADRPDSVGQPHSLVEVEVVDDEDRPLPPGQIGQLRIRSPGVATPLSENAASQFRKGWYYPGEIAHLDAECFIFLHGRVSEVVIRGGAKIHPAEVEAVLIRHPGVAEAVAVGRPLGATEQTLSAWVVPKGEVTIGSLLAHCRRLLAPHKVPQRFHIVSALPRTATGKTDKQRLATQP